MGESRQPRDWEFEFEIVADDVVRLSAAWVQSEQGRQQLERHAKLANRNAIAVALMSMVAVYGGLSLFYDVIGAGARGLGMVAGFLLASILTGAWVFRTCAPRAAFVKRVASSTASDRASMVGPGTPVGCESR